MSWLPICAHYDATLNLLDFDFSSRLQTAHIARQSRPRQTGNSVDRYTTLELGYNSPADRRA